MAELHLLKCLVPFYRKGKLSQFKQINWKAASLPWSEKQIKTKRGGQSPLSHFQLSARTPRGVDTTVINLHPPGNNFPDNSSPLNWEWSITFQPFFSLQQPLPAHFSSCWSTASFFSAFYTSCPSPLPISPRGQFQSTHKSHSLALSPVIPSNLFPSSFLCLSLMPHVPDYYFSSSHSFRNVWGMGRENWLLTSSPADLWRHVSCAASLRQSDFFSLLCPSSHFFHPQIQPPRLFLCFQVFLLGSAA